MSRVARPLSLILLLALLALAGVWTAGRVSPGYTLDLGPDEWGRVQNANDWEDNGRFTYRWTRGQTRFRLPALETPRRLVLRLDGTRPAGAAPAEVTLRLDGREVSNFAPASGPHLYHFVYDGADPWRWETLVQVDTAPFSASGDARELGVIIDRLHFSAPPKAAALRTSGNPLWALVALWAAVGAATLLMGRTLGWTWEGAAALAASLLLALSALLAWGRPATLGWASLLLTLSCAGAGVGLIFRHRGVSGAGSTSGRPREQDSPTSAVAPTPQARGKRPPFRPNPWAVICLALALLIATLPLLTRWLPEGGSWALHVMEPFYPRTGPMPRSLQRWLPLLAVAVVAVPFVNSDLRRLLKGAWAAGRRLTPTLRPPGRWLLLGLLFVPLGYALQARVLWGDGPHLIARIGAGYRFSEAAMLPFFVHATLFGWTEQLWGWSVPDVYTAVSLAAGALYVTFSAALSDALGRTRNGNAEGSRFPAALVFGLLVTLATVQFGFGYLENYAFVTVALMALFWRMVCCLQARGSPAAVVVLWVVACACHLQALFVGPAVLYTVVRAWRQVPSGKARWRQIWVTVGAGVVPVVVLVALFLAAGYDTSSLLRGGWSRGNNPYLFVPLRSDATYTLFSLRHLANLVNEHFLVAPVVLPLLLAVIACCRRRISWGDPLIIALGLGSAGLLLFASTAYPDLGAAMDWDLLAPAALAYTLLAGLLFSWGVPEGQDRRYGATVLLTSATVHTGLWVLLNARLL